MGGWTVIELECEHCGEHKTKELIGRTVNREDSVNYKGITIEHGDLFESECQAITNAVNIRGVMGGGIAKAFADRFPAMLEDYKRWCAQRPDPLPYLWVNDEGEGYGHHPDVLNFPTMIYPGERAKIGLIERGLEHVKENYKKWELESVAFCALGCGIGGLPFEVVAGMIDHVLGKEPIRIEVYAPR